MALPEYLYRMKAHELSRVDKEYDMHLSAWLGEQVTATKEVGSKTIPLYKSFDKFYDYEKAIEAITGPEAKQVNSQHKRMAQIAAKLNENT